MKKKKRFVAALAGTLLIGVSIVPARAMDIGPYFPLPNSFETKGGSVKDSLLQMEVDWLTDGIAALEKARKETREALEKSPDDAALAEKLKTLDEHSEAALKERAVLSTEDISKDAQLEQKRLFLLNLNKWINGLGKKATEQLKIAILKDGAERDAAERRHIQLSQQADELEQAKRDESVQSWGLR